MGQSKGDEVVSISPSFCFWLGVTLVGPQAAWCVFEIGQEAVELVV